MESKRVGNEQLEITHCFFFNIIFLFQEIGVRYHTEANLAIIMSVHWSLQRVLNTSNVNWLAPHMVSLFPEC